MSRTHDLKTWPAPFQAVLDGQKRYELRVNDRDFAVGHILRLREWHTDVPRPWDFAALPLGTRARSIFGGWWERTEFGWRANAGDTFPTPGADVGGVEAYTGRWLRARVTHITWGGTFGLPERMCVMSIDRIDSGPACENMSPPWFTGRWRDWHRGHGCDKDDRKPRTPEGQAEIERGGR